MRSTLSTGATLQNPLAHRLDRPQAAEQLALALVEWQRPPSPLNLGPLLAKPRPLDPSPLLDPRPLDTTRTPPASWIAAASPGQTTSAMWTSHW